MASQSLFTYEGGALVFDAVADASFSHEFEFTDLPVEDGSTISDNMIVKPRKASLTLVSTQTPISATPGFSVQGRSLTVQSVSYGKQSTKLDVAKKRGVQLNVANAIAAVGRALTSAVAGVSSIEGLKVLPPSAKGFSVKVLAADAPVDRVGEFYDALLKLALSATRLRLTFKGRDYPNLVLTSVTKQDAKLEVGRSVFAVELLELRTVVTRQVSLPAVPRAKAKKVLGVAGEQFGPPPPPLAPPPDPTIARQLAGFLGRH